MMEFFRELERVLQLQTPKEKITQFKTFYELYIGDKLSFNHKQSSKVFTKPSFDNYCNWFKWACERENVNPDNYFDIIEKVLPGAKKAKPYVNIKDRQKAGFSCAKILVLTDEKCND